MRARLRQPGGTLTVESAPGEGTALFAAVPLEAPRPDPSDTAGGSSVTASAVPYGGSPMRFGRFARGSSVTASADPHQAPR
ncbi:hypothetical protein GCM10010279_16040 [Streptomyces mutabilis]|nr:hypothetical protein GCM10010279_16040 [Streptomyces mutabilis]